MLQTTYKKLNELKQIGELNTQLAIEDLVADIASEYYFYIQQIKLFNNLAYAVSLSRERVGSMRNDTCWEPHPNCSCCNPGLPEYRQFEVCKAK